VISYNHNRNVCNWVAWNLNAGWFGDAERYSGQFVQDPLLPEAWYHVKHSDYTNSGYDRGHQVRSEERTRNDKDNLTTFYLTNILPQTPDLNQGVWLNMEYWCQNLCQSYGKELYIVSGGVFHSGTVIGNGVEVPDSCWKIVVVLNRGQGLKDVNENTLVYAVMIPNIAGVRNDTWDKYKTTVDRIEASTGYDFLRDVSSSIQNKIESRICAFTDDVPKPAKKKKR
jgi:endonuclease G